MLAAICSTHESQALCTGGCVRLGYVMRNKYNK